jgi:tetratricopeptide (TPR) repeat protein
MNCPHCGADTGNAVTICPLCGKTLDREDAYASYMTKGDAAQAAGELDKALLSYKKALEYSAGTEDLFLKLGNIYNKKADKQAASMYMKALSYNFYNDNTHNMLIMLYSKYGKLEDLKRWYEQSRAKADPDFIDKYIKIIENVRFFTTKADIKIPVTNQDKLGGVFMESMKKYMVMNIVLGIVLFVIGLAITAGVVFKLNASIIMLVSGVFLVVSIAIVLFSRRRKTGKKESGAPSLSDIMAEVSQAPRDRN